MLPIGHFNKLGTRAAWRHVPELDVPDEPSEEHTMAKKAKKKGKKKGTKKKARK